MRCPSEFYGAARRCGRSDTCQDSRGSPVPNCPSIIPSHSSRVHLSRVTIPSPRLPPFSMLALKRQTLGLTLSMIAALLALASSSAGAQDNYEIQVYGSTLLPPGPPMVELHSNFTTPGTTVPQDGALPP